MIFLVMMKWGMMVMFLLCRVRWWVDCVLFIVIWLGRGMLMVWFLIMKVV